MHVCIEVFVWSLVRKLKMHALRIRKYSHIIVCRLTTCLRYQNRLIYYLPKLTKHKYFFIRRFSETLLFPKQCVCSTPSLWIRIGTLNWRWQWHGENGSFLGIFFPPRCCHGKIKNSKSRTTFWITANKTALPML